MCELHNRDEVESAPRTVVTLVDELVVALTNARIYAPEHPRVAQSLDSLHAIVTEQLDANDGHPLVIGTADGYLFHAGRPLLGASLSARRIIGALDLMGAGGIQFDPRVDRDELLVFLELLGRGDRGPRSDQEAGRMLAQGGCSRVAILPEYGDGMAGMELLASALGRDEEQERRVIAPSEARDLLRSIRVPRAVYQDVVDGMQELTIQATRGLSVNLARTKGLVESVLKELTTQPKNLMGICRYERYDAFTFGHSIRVCSLALQFARHITDDEQLLTRIGTAALLHDIGKARVPFEILFATGRLTDEERVEMNRHSEYGGHILLDADQSDPIAVSTAIRHHSMYEDEGRKGPGPSIVTRIVKICDVFEALTAVRPYKDRMPPSRAYRIMFGMQGHFDQRLLRRFVEQTGLYPIGSEVQLSNGETARVHAQTADFERPVVDLEAGAFRETGERIDLADEGNSGVVVAELIERSALDDVA